MGCGFPRSGPRSSSTRRRAPGRAGQSQRRVWAPRHVGRLSSGCSEPRFPFLQESRGCGGWGGQQWLLPHGVAGGFRGRVGTVPGTAAPGPRRRCWLAALSRSSAPSRWRGGGRAATALGRCGACGAAGRGGGGLPAPRALGSPTGRGLASAVRRRHRAARVGTGRHRPLVQLDREPRG